MAQDKIRQEDLIDENSIKVWEYLAKELEKARAKMILLMRTSSELGGALKNATQIKELNDHIKTLTKAAADLNRVERALVDATNKTTASVKKETEAIKKSTEVKKQATKEVGFLEKAFSRFIGTALKFVTLYAGIQRVGMALKSVYESTKEFDSLSYSMSIIISKTKDLEIAQAFLSKIVNSYGLDLFDTTRAYIKFTAAAEAAGLETAKTQMIFDKFAKAGSVLGLSADSMNSVFLAIEQMLSKGRVSTEELRRQLGEKLPGAFNIMADALGITTIQLDKMLKKGQILSADALPKMAEALEKAYGTKNITNINTIVAAQERLNTLWRNFVKDLNSSEKIAGILNAMEKGFTSLLQKLGYTLDSYDSGRKKAQGLVNDISNGSKDAAEELVRLKQAYENVTFEITESEGANKAMFERLRLIMKAYDRDRFSVFTSWEHARNYAMKHEAEVQDMISATNGILTRSDKLLLASYTSMVAQSDVLANAINDNWKRAYVESLNLKEWEVEELERWDKLYADNAEALADSSVRNTILVGKERQRAEQVLRKDAIHAELERRRKTVLIEEEGDNDYLKRLKDRLNIEYEIYRKKQEEIRMAANIEFAEKTTDENAIKQAGDELKLKMEENLTNFRVKQMDRYKAAAVGNEAEILWAEEEAASKSADLAKKTADTKIQFAEETTKAYNDSVKQRVKDDIDAIMLKIEQSKASIEKAYADQSGSFKYDYQFKESDSTKNLDLLNMAYDMYDEMSNLYDLDYTQYVDIETRKAEIKQAIEKQKRDDTQYTAELEIEKQKAVLDFVSNSVNTLFGIFSDYNNARMSMADMQYEHDLNLAGDNTDQKIAAENKYQKEKRKIQKRAAILERAQSIFNIILSTLQGVAAAMATPATIPLVPFIKAMGAIQLAAAIATPIPGFKEGGEHEGGLAKFSEEGKQELFIPKDGSTPFLTPAKETIANMPAGTFVPNNIVQPMLSHGSLASTSELTSLISLAETNNLLRQINNKSEINYTAGTKIVKKSRIFGKYATRN